MRRPVTGGRGFTLLEMVVSLLLTMLILMLTAGLMNQIRLVFGREQRRVHEAVPQHALQLLRNDIHGAALVAAPSDIWTSGPLLLGTPDGGVVLWEHGADGLERTQSDADGESVSNRRLPAGFTGWRWRMVSPGLVDIELRLARRPTTGHGRFGGSAPWRDEAPRTRQLRLRLALRSALPGATW